MSNSNHPQNILFSCKYSWTNIWNMIFWCFLSLRGSPLVCRWLTKKVFFLFFGCGLNNRIPYTRQKQRSWAVFHRWIEKFQLVFVNIGAWDFGPKVLDFHLLSLLTDWPTEAIMQYMSASLQWPKAAHDNQYFDHHHHHHCCLHCHHLN